MEKSRTTAVCLMTVRLIIILMIVGVFIVGFADAAEHSALSNIFTLDTRSPYAGPVWYVSTDGSNTNDGSEESPFATIQHGINQKTFQLMKKHLKS